MSTRAWFILLNVYSHVGSVQLYKFGARSFCLFPSREWNSVVLFFLSFLLSLYLHGGGGTEAQIFVFPGLTHFYTELRALSLFSCLTALSTLKQRRNFRSVIWETKLSWMWLVTSPCRQQSLGTGKEYEKQKSLKQSWPCLNPTAQKKAVWLLPTNICAGPALPKGAFGTQVCFPGGGFQLGGCRWNLALYYNTNVASLLLWVYKEGEGAASFLWGWQWSAPKWNPSAVLAMQEWQQLGWPCYCPGKTSSLSHQGYVSGDGCRGDS